jgi:hypothetical protein
MSKYIEGEELKQRAEKALALWRNKKTRDRTGEPFEGLHREQQRLGMLMTQRLSIGLPVKVKAADKPSQSSKPAKQAEPEPPLPEKKLTKKRSKRDDFGPPEDL